MQQCIGQTSDPDILRSFNSSGTLINEPDSDDLWSQAYHKALRTLPAKDSEWLADRENQKAFTSTEICEAIRSHQEKYARYPAQRFLARIDPIVSHIRSFAGAINVFANANPMGAGIVSNLHLGGLWQIGWNLSSLAINRTSQ